MLIVNFGTEALKACWILLVRTLMVSSIVFGEILGSGKWLSCKIC